MTNFIFKSHEDLQKISQLVQVILTEQRHQRMDLAQIKVMTNTLINSVNLENQVKAYHQEKLDQDHDRDAESE